MTDDCSASAPGIVIGVDVGTTAAKVVAFGLRDRSRTSVACEYPLQHPEPDAAVQDPDVILAAVDAALAETVRRLDGARVELVSVSTAMHAVVGVDAKVRPVTPVITWADGRARHEARALRDTAEARALHARTGTPVHSMSPFVKLRWLTKDHPDLAAHVVTWLGLKDLVLHHLTGRVVTELSSASGTGLLNLGTRQWDPDAVLAAGIRTHQLPEVLPTTAYLPLAPEPARRSGIPVGTPVVVGAADGPLGNLGTGATAPGVAGLSIGTSGAIRLMTDRPYADPTGRLFCYALTDDLWAVGSAVSNGGSVVRWAGSVLGDASTSDEALLALADTVPAGSDGLVMLPFLLAERGPLWNGDLRGAYLGLRADHRRGHLVRAAVEGVGRQLATVREALEAVGPVTSVRATGGVFRAPLWRAVTAAALDRPLVVTGAAEGTALGAAGLGLYALGAVDSPSAGVELLTASHHDDVVELADPGDVATYRAVRAGVGTLLDQLRESAELLARRPSGNLLATDGNSLAPLASGPFTNANRNS